MMSQISEAEAVVMDVLWRSHPLGADEVVAALAERDWAEPTIKTLLNRLLTKGAVSASRDGRRYLYSPVLQRQAWVAEQSSGLLDKLFDQEAQSVLPVLRDAVAKIEAWRTTVADRRFADAGRASAGPATYGARTCDPFSMKTQCAQGFERRRSWV